MILAYLWIDNPNLSPNENIGYNFYGKYNFSFDGDRTITVEENENYIEDFYKTKIDGKSCIDSLTCIVGGNGSGKTTVVNSIKYFSASKAYSNYIEQPHFAILIDKTESAENWHCVYKIPSGFPEEYFKELDLSDTNETGKKYKNNFRKHNFYSFAYKYTQNLAVLQYSNYLDEDIDFDSESSGEGFYDIQTKTLINLYAKIYKRIHEVNFVNQLSIYKMKEYKNFFDYFLGLNKEKIKVFTDKYFKTTESEYDQIMRVYAYLKPVSISYESMRKSFCEKVGDNSSIIDYFDSINNVFERNIKSSFDKLVPAFYLTKDIYNYHKWIYTHSIWLLLVNAFDNVLDKNIDIQFLENIFGKLSELDIINPDNFLNSLKKLIFKYNERLINVNIPELFDNLNDFLSLLCNCKKDEKQFLRTDYLYVNIQDNEVQECLAKIIDSYMKTQNIPGFGDFCEFGWWRPLSSGEHAMLTLFSRLYKTIKNLKMHEKNLLVLIDEGEIGFHPYWQKRYVASLIEFFEMALKVLHKEDVKIQLIITTNNPIPLSDIQPTDVLFLKDHKVVSNKEKKVKAFGTDLLTLYADSFFINDGLIGKFADTKIKELIKRCKDSTNLNPEELEKLKKLSNNVGDEFISQYLSGLIDEKENKQ